MRAHKSFIVCSDSEKDGQGKLGQIRKEGAGLTFVGSYYVAHEEGRCGKCQQYLIGCVRMFLTDVNTMRVNVALSLALLAALCELPGGKCLFCVGEEQFEINK